MALKQTPPQNKPSEPVNVFRQNMKVEGTIKAGEITRENLRKIGSAFVDSLEKTFVAYLSEGEKKKIENPNLEALKKTIGDVYSYSQFLTQKFGDIFKTPPAPPSTKK